MNIEFPENTPRDVKRTLNPARDLDLSRYNTQRYNIVSGNVNNAFRLSSHRERDGVLYLDLQINGFLDRETTPAYSLVVEALDGGNPPLRGLMTVNITIQDVNDNQPIFNQSRYFATVPENATIGTTVLQVYATDQDAGDNGLVEYAINRRQSDKDQMFRIDANTGLISVNKPLDFETKELHELVVVAKDRGLQPLETTAFVSIRVTDVNDNQPIINVIFLSDDATPKISESAQPGEFVARISVNDPDSKTEYSNVNVTLSGGDGHFGLTTRDNIIYLVIVSLPLDREIKPNYTLSVVATDTGNPPLHASKTIFLTVTDINDNAPEFEKEIYHANVMEVADPGTSVIQVTAIDKDEGNNSAIAYSLLDTPDTHSQWFQIDSNSGLITTRAHIDCETDPVPQLVVVAKDNGFPPLSSTGTVLVTIHDVNDNEPIFDQSFYNVSVAENEPKGRCILKNAQLARSNDIAMVKINRGATCAVDRQAITTTTEINHNFFVPLFTILAFLSSRTSTQSSGFSPTQPSGCCIVVVFIHTNTRANYLAVLASHHHQHHRGRRRHHHVDSMLPTSSLLLNGSSSSPSFGAPCDDAAIMCEPFFLHSGFTLGFLMLRGSTPPSARQNEKRVSSYPHAVEDLVD
ncbi:protein dachsous-like [Uranotaenia lowii]|uniref:protein dachsous-like n=1 Tax=Uranotaenia lowii TaxID=190385 RepID=UPI00247ADE2B|nr:protein dachsous-like [Uranotaenia lowii]